MKIKTISFLIILYCCFLPHVLICLSVEISAINLKSKLSKVRMEPQNNISSRFQSISLQIEECQLHRLQKQKNICLFSGTLNVREIQNSQTPQQKIYELQLGAFKLKLNRPIVTLHAKEYSNSVSYLFEQQQQLKVISLLKSEQNSQKLVQFRNLLQQWGNYKSFIQERVDGAFKKKVFEMRPNVEVEQIWDKGLLAITTNYLVKGLGSVVGFLQTKAHGTTIYIDQKYRDSVQRLTKTEFAQSNKTKWQYVKDKAWQWDQTLTQWIKPIGNKTAEWTGKIGETLKKSDNKTIKYIKNLSKAAQKNLNQGYKSVVKSNGISTQNAQKISKYQSQVELSENQLKKGQQREGQSVTEEYIHQQF